MILISHFTISISTVLNPETHVQIAVLHIKKTQLTAQSIYSEIHINIAHFCIVHT